MEPGGRGWSPGAGGGARGPGVEPGAKAGTRALKPFSAESASPPPPGHQGPLCVYNLRPGKSAGPSRAGRCRDQKGLCCTGRGGRVCFSRRVWVPSPKPPGSKGSHFPGAVWTLVGFQPYFLPRPGPLVPPVTSQIPGITTPPKSPLLCPGEPARSREEPPRTKWAREGKEVGAAAHPVKSFAKPRGHHPHPLSGSCYAMLSHFSRVRLCATP